MQVQNFIVGRRRSSLRPAGSVQEAQDGNSLGALEHTIGMGHDLRSHFALSELHRFQEFAHCCDSAPSFPTYDAFVQIVDWER